MSLKLRQSKGEKLSDKTFVQAAERFIKEYEVMTGGTRNKDHVRGQFSRISNHLLSYFGNRPLAEVTAGAIQHYRLFRMDDDPKYQPPSQSMMDKEIVT
ncbi:hypothetical protein [Planktotalea sp.]|uniref:hypothetical protein n=1 Tax=Planktotalea sp. TaxID=2029877 RepID=UPI0025D69EDF|nr:hypothetical protein [Planktotalea sp.]